MVRHVEKLNVNNFEEGVHYEENWRRQLAACHGAGVAGLITCAAASAPTGTASLPCGLFLVRFASDAAHAATRMRCGQSTDYTLQVTLTARIAISWS